jgi:hypothetical protein
VATLKGLAEIAAKLASDQRALTDLAAKVARPLGSDPADLPRPEIPDIPAVREVTPLAEQIADLIKPPQGTPGHTPPRETRGRKPKWEWERAALAVFGRIYWGDVPEPTSQAEVETLLSEWFLATYDEQPVDSQIRDHARLIWREIRVGEN